MREPPPLLPAHSVPSLIQVSRQFSRWRSTRQVGERIPAQLWRSAVEAAHAFGVSKTSQTLRLDYNVLRQRMAVETTGGRLPELQQFVELTLPPPAPSPSAPHCRLEIRDRDGVPVRLDLSGWSGPDLAAFVRSITGYSVP